MWFKNKFRKKLFIPFFAITGFLVILTGQGNFSSFSPLPTLFSGKELFAEEGRVRISVKSLNTEESKKYLRSDLLKEGYVPLQITIENQSPDPYLITPESISLPLVSPKEIAGLVKKSALPASIGLKIAGFLFWPLSIPSTMHGIKTMQSYKILKKDLITKSVKEEIIAPYTTMNRVFFVTTESHLEEFSVSLVNQDTLETKLFSVQDPMHPKVLKPLLTPEENYYLAHEK
jgi:hypothetical protein